MRYGNKSVAQVLVFLGNILRTMDQIAKIMVMEKIVNDIKSGSMII